jgi:hypothetical protein
LFKKGYGAIVVDSASHEHDGYGGYLDSQHNDLEVRISRYMGKYPQAKEYEVREKLTPSSWVEPKLNRKRMMQTLLACSSTVPVIFCFRAEEKVFTSEGDKLVARKIPEWEPVCGKGLPFEMTTFFMFNRETPGVISKVIKLPGNLKEMFPLGKQLGEISGETVAAWAHGAVVTPEATINEKEIIDGLKKQLSAMMTGFHKDEKANLFNYALEGKAPTVDLLQNFIDNYEEKKLEYMQSKT